MKAVVLAAGKSTRHFPLTGVIPKPLASVTEKPVMQHIFELLARWGKGLWVGERLWIHPSAYGYIEGHAGVGERAMIGGRASLQGA